MNEASWKPRLERLRSLLLGGLIERDEPVRLALLAAIAGEHLLLLGPPGTAKSEIARRLRHAFRGAAWFERLLTRFTVPEELFGPLSIAELKQDRYHRQTEGYLPTAHVAFLDEVFKANSAILNALLTLLNEKEFDNGTVRSKTPIVCVVAASNELPEGEGMAALFDRFLLRCHVGAVTDEGFGKLLLVDSTAPEVPADLQLTPEDLHAMRAAAGNVMLPDDVLRLLRELRKHLAEQKVDVSDRRWRKIVGLLRTSAFTNGRTVVDVWDCWLVQHCTWNRPEQREVVKQWYEKRVGAAQGADPAHFERVTASFEEHLRRDSEAEVVATNAKGLPLFVGANGRSTTSSSGLRHKRNAQGELLYHQRRDFIQTPGEFTVAELRRNHLVVLGGQPLDDYVRDPSNWVMEDANLSPWKTKRSFSRAVINKRLVEAKTHGKAVNRQARAVAQLLESLPKALDQHLWVTPGFGSIAQQAVETTVASLKQLVKRWNAIEKGIRGLPIQKGDA